MGYARRTQERLRLRRARPAEIGFPNTQVSGAFFCFLGSAAGADCRFEIETRDGFCRPEGKLMSCVPFLTSDTFSSS